MKKRIISIILAIMLLVPCFGVINVFAASDEKTNGEKYLDAIAKVTTDEQKLALMSKVTENETLELYVQSASGEIAIRNKLTGEIMFSNPTNVTALNTTAKQKILSTITMKFKQLSSSVEVEYFSFRDAAMYDQVVIVPNANGVSVTYRMGREELLVPLILHSEDFDQIIQEMKDAGVSERDINSISRLYAQVEDLRKIETTEKNKEAISVFFKQAGYTFERMHAAYERVGYDRITGNIVYGDGKYSASNNVNIGVGFQPSFTLTVDYALTSNGIDASVNLANALFDETKYVLTSICVLPYFNGTTKGESGYSFLPDGSGTLVRYEDLLAAGSTDSVSTPLYGPDYAYYTVDIKNQEQAIFPVFGNVITSRPIKTGFFAIIEQGDTLATIISENQSINSVYPSFKVSASDKYDLADSSSSGVTDKKVITVNGISRYVGSLNIKYVMLTPSELGNAQNPATKYDTSYVGMANCYRDYLQAKGDLTKLDPSKLDANTRLFLEVFGSIKAEEKILSFPVTVNKALTTFSDIIAMHKSLANYGVNNMSFILTGFANGGLDSKYPTYLKWQNVLGGKDGYNELKDYAQANGVEISVNVDFAYSNELRSFSGFSYKKTAARALDGRYTTKRQYDASIQMFQRKGGVVISTASYELAYTKFLKSAKDYEITSLATRTLGSDISSDFDEDTGYIFREQSRTNIQNMLNNLSSSYNLILDAGNAYTLKYASGLLKTPLDSSRRLNTSEAVPFVGIVLHGSLEFAGDAINMEGDSEYMFLKALESGSCLYFTVAMQNTELLKINQDYSNYYSVKFETWKNSIINLYKEFNSVMASKQGVYISEHEFLNADDGYKVIRTQDLIDNPNAEPAGLSNSRVVRVEYENGEGFILNYNSYEIMVEYNGVAYTIGGLDYATYTK